MTAMSGSQEEQGQRRQHHVEHPLDDDLVAGQRDRLEVQERLVRHGHGPQAAVVDAADAGRQVDVGADGVQVAGEDIDEVRRHGAGGDDGPGDLACRATTSGASSAVPSQRRLSPCSRASERRPSTPTTRKPISGCSSRIWTSSAASAPAPTTTTSRVLRPSRRRPLSQARYQLRVMTRKAKQMTTPTAISETLNSTRRIRRVTMAAPPVSTVALNTRASSTARMLLARAR